MKNVAWGWYATAAIFWMLLMAMIFTSPSPPEKAIVWGVVLAFLISLATAQILSEIRKWGNL